MEKSNLLELLIDGESTKVLSEAARWGKFLAIVGYIVSGFMLIGALSINFLTTAMMEGAHTIGGNDEAASAATAYTNAFMAIFYAVLSLINIIPCIFLHRFASRMQQALRGSDQDVLNSSFSNLKSMFKFVGIVTIIMIAFIVVGSMFAGYMISQAGLQ